MRGASAVLLWLGVVGPPAAWTAQLVIGYAAEEADCSRGSGSFDGAAALTLWSSVGAGLVAVLSLLGAAWILRETRRGGPPDRGRIPFMASAGVLTGLLFLALIVFTAVGATHFDPCRAG